MRDGEIQPVRALDPLAEIASVLAKGYLRLLARKAAPVAANGPEGTDDFRRNGLDDVGHKSVHGDG